MQLSSNGLTFSVDDATVSRVLLERFRGIDVKLVNATLAPPRIAAEWKSEGGIYAGIARGRDGADDYYLVVGPEHPDEITWQAAMDWAPTVKIEGHADFAVFYRREQALAFANVPELFKPVGYWSCETHASGAYGAWGQYFSDGYQDYWFRDYSARARLVRRVAIGF
jgi:hypothetical protein